MATLEDKIFSTVRRIQENTSLKSLVPGTTIYSMVEATSYEQMKLESNQEAIELKTSIANATGRHLDFIGNTFFGIVRRKAIAPVITSNSKMLKIYVDSGTFGGINSGNSIIIQPGELIMEGVASNGYWKFANTEALTLQKQYKELYINANLIIGPYDIIPTNSITSHNFTNYSDAANNSLKITNETTVATGRAEESDDNFRYRINNALKSFVKTNYFGIHDAITDVPGISNVQIANASNGGGTFTLYAQSISPTTSKQLLADVEGMAIQNIPPWVSYNIIGPNYIGIKLGISVTLQNLSVISDRASLEKQIINTVSLYINNVQQRSFYIPEIINAVIASSQSIVSCSITSASVLTGQDQFRSQRSIDLTDDLSKYIFIGNNEKLIVEPVLGAITVSLQ